MPDGIPAVSHPSDPGYVTCPEHGDTMQCHEDQGGEHEQREHLECWVRGCDYEEWA